MKALFLALLIALMAAPLCRAERAVPFDNLSLHMMTWPKDGQFKAGAKLRVFLSVEWDSQKGDPSCGISAYLPALDTKKRFLNIASKITLEDIGALQKVVESAAQKKPNKISTWTKGKGFRPRLATTYESIVTDDVWQISILHAGQKTILTIDEAFQLVEAYTDAHASMQWYEKLLRAKELPTPERGAKPPSGSIQRFSIHVGALKRDELIYTAFVHGIDDDPVTHYMELPSERGEIGAFHGKWVRNMMFKTVEAAQVAQTADGYSFIGRQDAIRYAITADPSDKTAELRIHPFFGYSRMFVQTADYDLEAANELADLIKQADKVNEWMNEHRGLLIAERQDPEGDRVK